MTTWNDYPPPHDRPIWLFLPCSRFVLVEGRPTNISHEVVLAQWNEQAGGFRAVHDSGALLYGSKWFDYHPGDSQPEEPDLGQQA